MFNQPCHKSSIYYSKLLIRTWINTILTYGTYLTYLKKKVSGVLSKAHSLNRSLL